MGAAGGRGGRCPCLGSVIGRGAEGAGPGRAVCAPHENALGCRRCQWVAARPGRALPPAHRQHPAPPAWSFRRRELPPGWGRILLPLTEEARPNASLGLLVTGEGIRPAGAERAGREAVCVPGGGDPVRTAGAPRPLAGCPGRAGGAGVGRRRSVWGRGRVRGAAPKGARGVRRVWRSFPNPACERVRPRPALVAGCEGPGVAEGRAGAGCGAARRRRPRCLGAVYV